MTDFFISSPDHEQVYPLKFTNKKIKNKESALWVNNLCDWSKYEGQNRFIEN